MEEVKTEKIYRSIDNKKLGVAFILARGGSKRVKRKNLRLLAGKPLIEYSIRAALESPYISECFVSTEDREIKDVSLKLGATVVDRPSYLSGDLVTSSDTIRHLIDEIGNNGITPKWFVLLQPTSPFRDCSNLNESIELFYESNMNNVVSLCEMHDHPYKCFIEKKGELLPVSSMDDFEKPAQLLPPAFKTNGAIYIIKTEEFIKRNRVLYEGFTPYIMDSKRSVDIDTEEDFEYAEFILSKKGRNE